MEEITAEAYAQRKLRLRLLIDLEHDGAISSLIRSAAPEGNRSRSSYISQIQSGHRAFTESAARRIEVDSGKPVGWLDGLRDSSIQALQDASNLRVERLRQYLASEFAGDIGDFFTARHPGPRRQKLVEDLLNGTRFLSNRNARALEAECGIPAGFLDQE